MPAFSERSMARLETCEPALQCVFLAVVRTYDCTVLEGHRSAERQAALLVEGRTKVGRSQHNHAPSRAVDVAPWPIPKDWGTAHPKEMARFYHFAGFVQGVAEAQHVPLRWGGDWNSDRHFRDQTFDDLVHFEIARRR